MRSRHFTQKKFLPQEHLVRSIPGGWIYPGLIARNIETLINARPYQNEISQENWYGDIPYRETLLKDYLKPYQKDFLERYAEYESVYLKWAGGAGKTIASLLWAKRIFNAKDSAIFVATTAGAKAQWESAVKELFGEEIKVQTIYGETSATIAQDVNLIIVNWDILAAQELAIDGFLSRKANRILIYDEIHKVKNWRRVKTELNDEGELQKVELSTTAAVGARLARTATRRLGLSATPYSVGVGDLWAQLDSLEPDCWGTNWQYVHSYCDAKPGARGGLDTTGESNIEELRARLRTMMHVVSRTELEKYLPWKRREVIYLSKEQLDAAYKGAQEDLQRSMLEGEESFYEAQVGVAASMKRSWTVDTAVETMLSNRRVVILTNRREEVENLAEALRKKLPKKLKDNILASHGGSELSTREEQKVKYRDNPHLTLCLIGTHDAWGTAIDGLQSTDVAINNALPNTAMRLGQSETRFIRQGQDRPCVIMYPVAAGTVDEIVNSRLLARLNTLKDLLDGESESDAARRTLAGLDTREATLQNFLKDF